MVVTQALDRYLNEAGTTCIKLQGKLTRYDVVVEPY
jgi:hypothetical protein